MATNLRPNQQLQDSPELQTLILRNVTPTGKVIGTGSYGSVEEVEIPGAVCAAKKIHDFLSKVDRKWLAKEVAEENIRKFVAECKLMNQLRHPNIVQFIGIWFSKGSSLPALVMEKMLMSLHDLLEPDEPTPEAQVPLGLKCSILQDIAQGIAFLHNQSPPVVHRDLSARNVLLNSAMVAKIADLGMARILPDKANATMTKAPGALVYMPPETLGDNTSYDTSIDVFSLGVLIIFVLAQEFPQNLKPPTYTNKKGKLLGRTELERREEYMEKLCVMLSKNHPLVKLTTACLQNDPKRRPSINNALKTIGQAVAQVQDQYVLHSNKLKLLQRSESMQQNCDDLRQRLAQLEQQNSKLQLELAKEKKKDYVDRDKLPSVPPLPPRRESSLKPKPHERIETWYKEVTRDYANKLLKDCVDGTFLCRPTSTETELPCGGFHTHTIAVARRDGMRNYRVILHNGKYGFQAPYNFESLMDLVLYYSEHNIQGPETNIRLKYPVFCSEQDEVATAGSKLEKSDSASEHFEQVVALYDYEAQGFKELSFKEDDILTIITKTYDDWWYGQLDGKTGMIPAPYVASYQ